MANFRDLPAYKFGLEGENKVKQMLRESGAMLIHMDDYTPDGSPRIENIVSPDFLVVNKNSLFVEVKTKTEATLHNKTGKYEHGFGKRLYHEYIHMENKTGKEVWVVFVVVSRDEILCCRPSKTPINHVWDTTRLKGVNLGGMIYFAVEDLHPLSVLLSRIRDTKKSKP